MSDLSALVKATAVDLIAKHNALVEKISANTADKGRLVHEIREDRDDVTDESVLKFRAFVAELDEKREQAVQAINAYIVENLMPKADESVDVDALKTEVATIREEIKAAKVLLKGDEEGLPEVKTLRGTSGGGGGGTGGRRPRVESIQYRVAGTDEWTEVYKDVDDKRGGKRRVSNFTLAAQALSSDAGRGVKVEVSDLQAAAFSGAGTDDLSTLNGQSFVFGFTAGEKNYEVRVNPRAAE